MRQIDEEYETQCEIGSGGMATVYKAVQRSLGRTVAIKELKKDFTGDDRLVQRFEREARTAASFQHENIVHIYDYWSRPTCSIVMEHVDGISLSEIMMKAGPLPTEIGVMIAVQVASALAYAHMHGVVHRDIKPSNIMVKRNGEVKLMDFGIARVRDLEPLTIPGMMMGTPSYMSPEQVLGDPLDPRSDIFSLGIVLYEMFTGMKPFVDEETQSITRRIVQASFPAPRRLNGDIPRRLQWVIKKCLKKKPPRRYAAVQDLSRALGRLLRGKTDKPASLKRISDYLVAEGLVEQVPEQESIVLSRSSFSLGAYSKSLLAAAIILLLLLCGAAYWLWGQTKAAVVPSPAPALQGQPAASPAPEVPQITPVPQPDAARQPEPGTAAGTPPASGGSAANQ